MLTALEFPFNNSCNTHNSMLTNLNMTGLRLEVARDTDRHVKKTLPPSLSGFPGEAEIKYYVKATIVRPQFYKENIRSVCPPSSSRHKSSERSGLYKLQISFRTLLICSLVL